MNIPQHNLNFLLLVARALELNGEALRALPAVAPSVERRSSESDCGQEARVSISSRDGFVVGNARRGVGNVYVKGKRLRFEG